MRRYQLVLGGTAAGIAGVLAFHPSGTHLTLPPAGAGVGGTPSPTTPATAAGGSSTRGATAAGPPASSPTTTAPTTSPTTAPATRTATSSDQTYPYGDLAVTVTVQGTRITKLSMATLNETDGRSYAIDHYAVPLLERQVIRANSVNIDGVSGATFTSQAFVDGVANALSKLGIRA